MLHLFMCLSTICISCLDIRVFKSFVHFWIELGFLKQFFLKSNFLFFLLLPLMSYPRNHCQIQCCEAFALYFTSFMFFRSWVHFELIFKNIVLGNGPTSFFCMWISRFSSTICWKDCVFPIEWSWHPCHLAICVRVYFWTLILLVHVAVFLPVPHCFDYCSFVISFKVNSPPDLSSPALFFSGLFWLFRVA